MAFSFKVPQASPFGRTSSESRMFGSTPSRPAFGTFTAPSFGTFRFGTPGAPIGGPTVTISITSSLGNNTITVASSDGTNITVTPNVGTNVSITPIIGTTITITSNQPSTPVTSSPAGFFPFQAFTSTPRSNLFNCALPASAATCQSTPTVPSSQVGDSSPYVPQTSSLFGFGLQSSPFGGHMSSTTLPGNKSAAQSIDDFPALRSLHGRGSRMAPYTPVYETEACSGPMLASLSAMPIYDRKSHEELRWEDYQMGDKVSGGLECTSGSDFGFNMFNKSSLQKEKPISFGSPFARTYPSPFETSNSTPYSEPTPFSSPFGTPSAQSGLCGPSVPLTTASHFSFSPFGDFGKNSSSHQLFGCMPSQVSLPAQTRTSPFSNNQTSTSPFSNNQTSTSPFTNNQTSTSPFTNNQTSTSPFTNNQTSISPFTNNQTSTSPFGNNQNSNSPFGNNQNSTSPFSNNQTSTSPLGNNQTSNSPYGNNQNSTSLFSNNQTSASPFSNHTSTSPFSNNQTETGSSGVWY